MKVDGMSDAQVEKEMKKTIRVKAVGDPEQNVGYYNHLRRRGGDVFILRPIVRKRETIVMDGNKPVMIFDNRFKKEVPKREIKTVLITAEQQFSEKWMERIKENLPETKPVHFNKTNAGKGTLTNKLNIPGMTSKVGGDDDMEPNNVSDGDDSPSNDEAVI